MVENGMHIEGWHAWTGGSGALVIVIGMAKWLFTSFNGKADKSTVKKVFEKVDENTKDITHLKETVAVTKTKVENIETVVEKIDTKLDRLLDRRAP